VDQSVATTMNSGQFILLSRNSKLARMFQEVTAPPPTAPPARRQRQEPASAPPATRTAACACPKLQSPQNPNLELTRPLVAALMREQAAMRCRARGVLLDNEYVRDVCAAGSHQHCPFLLD
jgi:hypothetical protein